MKKPKLKKHPKKPKASASLAAWERYDAKCRQIEKDNKHAEATYNAAVKKKHSLIKKHSK